MPKKSKQVTLVVTAEREPTRDGFGRGLVEAGQRDERVVVLCADLAESTRCHWFAKEFPHRFVEVGVAEQNLAVLASGMAAVGKIPFIASYATFSPGRNNEQIRTNICLNNQPVKVIGCHAGLSVGPDGATHQALEDIALMRVLPRMTVVVPCDAVEAQKATLAILAVPGPAYLRLGRDAVPTITSTETPFEVGKANILRHGKDVAIIACGAMVYEALVAAQTLADNGVEARVINMHTVKPLDAETLTKAATECGRFVVAEEHQVAGGLGSAVAEWATAHRPVPMEFVGVRDQFGQSGTPEELMRHYGLTAEAIVEAVGRVEKR
jgi:transketolase